MAESIAAVGLVAAILQFIEFGTKIVARLNEFDSKLSDVPKAFRDVKEQLPLIIDTLKRTRGQADAGYMEESTKRSLRHVIEGCQRQIEILKKILDKAMPAEDAPSWKKRWSFCRGLTYDKDIERTAKVLDGYITTLNFHQTTTGLDIGCRSMEQRKSSPNGCSTQTQKPIFMVPFHRNHAFVSGQETFEVIETKLNMRYRRAALAGIGGVG